MGGMVPLGVPFSEVVAYARAMEVADGPAELATFATLLRFQDAAFFEEWARRQET